MDWDRLCTLMIRQMIQQFRVHPGDFLTFGQLAHRIPDADADVLHAIAEQRRDLFVITRDDRRVKLHLEAVERIDQEGIERAVVVPEPVAAVANAPHERRHCNHFSEEQILADLLRCSLPSEALTRGCCWREICRVRGHNLHQVSQETWNEVCGIRGYLRRRQNPRGF